MSLDDKLDRYDEYIKNHFSEDIKKIARKRANFFQINKNDLFNEVTDHPSILNYVGRMLEEAQKARDSAKANKTIVKARRSIDLSRTSMPGTGKSPTLPVLSALAESDQQVIVADAELIMAEKVLKGISIDWETVMQKGRMLELVKKLIDQELYTKGYVK